MLKIARFTFFMFGINTYVVYDPDKKEAAIIDPGMSRREEFDAMEKFIVRENLTVTHLINTHLHIDHAIADKWVQDKYGVPVEAHEEDSTLGKILNQQAQRFGLRDVDAKVEIGRILKDGDKMKIGDGTLLVLHVPGHSPGSIALYDKEGGWVISGDTLFEGSIGRTDLMGGDHAQLIQAITDKLLTLPGDTVVYPGHGRPTTIEQERTHNPYL